MHVSIINPEYLVIQILRVASSLLTGYRLAYSGFFFCAANSRRIHFPTPFTHHGQNHGHRVHPLGRFPPPGHDP
jgi:hypothetical protein